MDCSGLLASSEFFFFQAEDGIRDYKVTGVQTCALPISERRFDDTTFHTVQQLAEVRYSGVGVSGSLLLGVAPGLSVIGWGRAPHRPPAPRGPTTRAPPAPPRLAGGGGVCFPRPRGGLSGGGAPRRG